jgi:outer membrane protein TolC
MTRRLLALVITLCAVPAAGQEAAAPLTLEQAIAEGLAHSARLAELDARDAGAAAAAAGRRAAGLPVVAASAGYMRTNHVEEFAIVQPGQPPRVIYPDVPDNYRARLDLQWPIFTGGRIDALVRAADAERTATAADREAARADLRLEITRAFWALVTAREAEQVVQRSLESLQAHAGDLRSREAQGLIPPNEVLTAEARISRRRVLVIEAANAARIAESDLVRLLGRDDGARLDPVEPLAPPAPSAGDRDIRRPERVALAARVDAAEAREAAAGAAGKPQVALAGGYDIARPNPRIFPRADAWHPSWDVSVNVAWTLWDGGRRQAEAAEAAANARAITARVTEFDRQVRFEVTQRQLELEASLAAIAAADDGIRAATEARRVVGERFAAGVATSTDVLDAELAVLEAELDRTRALAAARLAAARYARAVGTP